MNPNSTQDKIRDLNATLTTVKKQNRKLLVLGVFLTLVLLLLAIKLYQSYVLQYAILKDIRIEQSTEEPQQVVFYYKVAKPGLVAFGHGEARLTSQVSSQGSDEHQFTWRWANRGSVTISVRFRRWLFPGNFSKQFNM